MAFGKRKRNRFKFTGKTHSKKGILASVLAAALLVLYGAFVMLAYKNAGNLSMYFGSAGVLAIAGVIVAIVLSVQSLKEENSFPLFPRLAMGLSILAVISWIGTYTAGILL